MPATDEVEAGDIVCADPRQRERAIRCSKNDRAILGIISDGTGGFLINANGRSADALLTGKPLVLAGRVPVKVSLENGPIQIGDSLAPSSRPGVAMLTVTLTTTNTAIVSRPFPSTGFALEQNPALGTTNWTSVTNSVSNDGSFNWVVVPANTGNKFYRLKKKN